MTTTVDEKLQNVETRIKQLEARKKMLQAKAKEQERKDRTRRLIQIGAVMQSVGMDTEDKALWVKHWVLENDEFRKAFHEAMLPKERNDK